MRRNISTMFDARFTHLVANILNFLLSQHIRTLKKAATGFGSISQLSYLSIFTSFQFKYKIQTQTFSIS